MYGNFLREIRIKNVNMPFHKLVTTMTRVPLLHLHETLGAFAFYTTPNINFHHCVTCIWLQVNNLALSLMKFDAISLMR